MQGAFRILALTILAIALTAPSAVGQTRATFNANAAGNRALDTADYELALQKFEKALQSAEKSRDDQYRAIAMYGLARANAYLCRVGDAEKWFRDSIALRETVPNQEGTAYRTQNFIEFSRFLLANGRPEEAAPYLGRAVTELEALGIEQQDPIGYAEFLDVYVATLQTLGRTTDAEQHAQRATGLREKYRGQSAYFKPKPYPSNCSQT